MPAIFTLANKGQNGVGLMGRYKLISLTAVIATYASSFYVWHRVVGYNKTNAMEQAYAKHHKMLRNLIIQQ